MRSHLTFLSWFVISLAIAAAAFFAAINGIPQIVYQGDMSHATSVIAVLFIGTQIWAGIMAWRIDNLRPTIHRRISFDLSFGHLSERLCVMAGLAGTTIGLSLQGKALMSGSASFGALSTSLFTTATGVVSAALVSILVFNLERGITRCNNG